MTDLDRLRQARARLISLREQRARMAQRAADLQRGAAARAEAARRGLDQARAEQLVAHQEIEARRAVLGRPGGAPGPAGESPAAAWRRVNEALEAAHCHGAAVDARVEAANHTLQHVLRADQAAIAEHATALGGLEAEIDALMREIAALQARRPLPDAPDPALQEMLLGRLRHLDEERAWLGEEIVIREERVRRISVERSRLLALLEAQTPEWGREAQAALVAAEETAPERPTPPWRAAVVELLGEAEQPVHYRQIAESLARLGQGLGGQDPAETLLAALSRDPGFVRMGRGLYGLQGRAYEEFRPPDDVVRRRLREHRARLSAAGTPPPSVTRPETRPSPEVSPS